MLTDEQLPADVEVGRTYVYLDGQFLPKDVAAISLDGWHAHHELEVLLQLAALEGRRAFEATLARGEYRDADCIADERT